ncbi:MAG: hypothetical protein KJ822_16290, partial [Proteobacteria bacterium]|nr:hypothetical protein [Pseudomonadota bacterium]
MTIQNHFYTIGLKRAKAQALSAAGKPRENLVFSITWCKTCLQLQICFLNQLKVGNGDLKSPFPKGGFRRIIKRLYNTPCPPLKKGGKILAFIGAF